MKSTYWISMENSEEDRSTSINELKSECEQIWKAVHMAHKDIVKTEKVQTSENMTNPILAICQAKEKRLQAEVKALKHKPLNVLPQKDDILKVVIKDELQTTLKQLEETLSDVKIRKNELEEELHRTETHLHQQQELQEAILSKMETAERGANIGLIREAEKKLNKMENYADELEQKLAQFLERHFPVPSVEDIESRKGKRKRQTSSQTTLDQFVDGKQFLSLKRLIKRMSKKYFESPHDPYIMIEERYWPPYIELLLRCGVIVKNPQNSQYIKLTPFHL